MTQPNGYDNETTMRCFEHRMVGAFNHNCRDFIRECAACEVLPLQAKVSALETESEALSQENDELSAELDELREELRQMEEARLQIREDRVKA